MAAEVKPEHREAVRKVMAPVNKEFGYSGAVATDSAWLDYDETLEIALAQSYADLEARVRQEEREAAAIAKANIYRIGRADGIADFCTRALLLIQEKAESWQSEVFDVDGGLRREKPIYEITELAMARAAREIAAAIRAKQEQGE